MFFSRLTYAHGLLLAFGGINKHCEPERFLYALELPDYKVNDLWDTRAGARYSVHGSVEETYAHSMIAYCGDLYVFDGIGRDFMPTRLKRL